MNTDRSVTVFGAYGHTGRFVVSELRRRGWAPILSGRDAEKLNQLADAHAGLDVRPATIESPLSLDRALAGASAVINCAGPFLDTAGALIEAALRAQIHYLDVTAEQAAVRAVFERFSDTARERGITIIPAMAFYGGLADLLATSAIGDWVTADEILVAVALDSWRPTLGTRRTGERNTFPRVVFTGNRLETIPNPPPRRTWSYRAPFGTQEVVALVFSEIITISHHLRVPEVHAFMNLAPVRDVRDPSTPPPTASDESGRSSQIFLVDVIARRGGEERRAVASGRDIYSVTAPLVVEAAQRLVAGRGGATGVVAPGEVFDARDFLESLSPAHLSLELP
jgi:short subunit dehydrogenase-like uncharacterized protein